MRKFEVVSDEFRQHKGVDIILPKRSTSKSAGYDFYLPCDVEIEPNGSTGIIPTDVKARMNYGEVLLLFIRSSLGIKKDIILKNNVGVIDGDYYGNPSNDGNIGIALRNLSNEKVCLKKGEKIMQGIFVEYFKTNDDNVENVRTGGFGSTK